MTEKPPDDAPFSPDDLKRMGLAGHGDLRPLRRAFVGFPAYLRALRPTWRGVILTVLAANALAETAPATP